MKLRSLSLVLFSVSKLRLNIVIIIYKIKFIALIFSTSLLL